MQKERLMVGEYVPETENKDAVIHRAFYRQGYVVKDAEAYLHCINKVCYVPELSDTAYSHQDFLDLCNGQEKFAKACFEAVDWQHPETWLDEQFREEEWGFCPRCNKIYDMQGERCACPVCGGEFGN